MKSLLPDALRCLSALGRAGYGVWIVSDGICLYDKQGKLLKKVDGHGADAVKTIENAPLSTQQKDT